ncbi:TlpA family protein disulfide reductase [Gryllotalpicola protaetiae]|uniref:Thioredoxin n=1 Tax=Gryllotalpicola protaetiae TaxID=2419771 RepID=A0A387C1Z3_9MICO|nr:thioredoxin family protein [Gryllotalpicola protaetiae]AYG04531.1 thioredoxin [Gryllotalpicola protaetiae]
MSPLAAVLSVLGLIAAATVVGLVWKQRTGRVAPASGGAQIVSPADVGAAAPFGEKATLLQFSTEFCAYCPATRRVLGGLADANDGVAHVDVDLTHSPELAQRFRVLQTPTTLLLDGDGAVRARIGGAPKRAELEASLARILNGDAHVAA